MRIGYVSLLLAVALLFGCGSDGGGSSSTTTAEDVVQTVNLGLVRSDAPTTFALPVRKPFYPAARVELAAPPVGAFTIADTLPMLVDGGETPTLYITFTPPVSGSPVIQTGTIELLFCRISGEGSDCPVTLKLEAEIEKPSARLLQTQLLVGNAAIGETVKFGVYFENSSKATAVTLEEVTLPAGPFSLDPDGYQLPCPVGPGSRFYVKLIYAPDAVGTASADIVFRHTASAQPLIATASGTGIAPRVVHDFGTIALDAAFETSWLTFEVAPEATGILIEAWGDPDALIDLIGFEGPDGTVYATYDLGGPLNWLDTYPAGARGHLFVELPSSSLPELQLSGTGTYRFRLRDAASVANALEIRATVSQRRQAKAQQGTLDVRVFLSDGLTIADRSDPMSDIKLATVMQTIDAILGQHGVRLGAVTFSFLPPAYDVVAGSAAVENLLATVTAGLPEGPLNLFLVKDMGVGVTGVAGAVPGPKANGTPYSGVVIDYAQWQGIPVGANAAHQIGHYLGHMDEDGVETVILAPEEAYPVLRHPLVGPGVPANLVSPPETTNYALIDMMVGIMAPMPTWCGTCTRLPLR